MSKARVIDVPVLVAASVRGSRRLIAPAAFFQGRPSTRRGAALTPLDDRTLDEYAS